MKLATFCTLGSPSSRRASCWALFAAAIVAAGSGRASADVITLTSFNSTATFATEATDPAPRGLYDWSIDGTDHIAQQWFWYRVGNGGPEAAVDSLTQTFIDTDDADNDGLDDILTVRYRDANQSFEVSLTYLLTGAVPGDIESHLDEVVTVRNLTDNPLDFHLFQFVDFDLGGNAGGDRVEISGSPVNTARQTDGAFEVAETVVTPPPSHFEVGVFGDPNSIEGRLGDGAPTTLADIMGPLVNVDATWAFQWDREIAPRDIFILSKVKSLNQIPEPSTIALASLAAVAFAARVARTRYRRKVGQASA